MHESCWKVEYLEPYWEKLGSNFALCGVKTGVFHDSELNENIYFAPKPLLGGKRPLFANPSLIDIGIYLNRHNNLNVAPTVKHLKSQCLSLVSMPLLMQFLPVITLQILHAEIHWTLRFLHLRHWVLQSL